MVEKSTECELILNTRRQKSFLILMVFLVACQKTHSAQTQSESILIDKPETLKASPSKNSTVYFLPFAEELTPNTFWQTSGSWKFGVPKTVSGYHWPWVQGGNLYVGNGQGGLSPLSLETLEGQTAPVSDQQVLAFSPDATQSNRNRWPAVVGNFGKSGGSLSPLFLAQARPVQISEPIRIYFLDNAGKALHTSSRIGKSCGEGCYDVESFFRFLDEPVTFAKAGQKVKIFSEGANGSEVRFLLSQSEPKWFSDARTSGLLLGPLAALFSKLGKEILPSSSSFDFHTVFGSGCGYQGLEHPTSTLLSFGLGCSSSGATRSDFPTFLNLAVHEMVHVWNGKRIYPSETQNLSTAKFSEDRNRQLYFFEGFTEGLTRLLLASHWGPKVQEDPSNEAAKSLAESLRSHLLLSWNQTASEIQRTLGNEGSLEDISLENVSLGYVYGSWLALEHLAQALLNRGAPSVANQTVFQESIQATLGVLANLGQGFRGAAEPFWKSFQLKVTEAVRSVRGYTKTELKAALLADSQLLGNDPLGLVFALDSQRNSDRSAFEDRFRLIASAIGREVLVEQGVLQFGPETVSGDSVDWIF